MNAETYRGVPVPDRIQRDRAENGRYSALFHAWREGVDEALDVSVPPKPAGGDPFAPDLTMSREVADFILRAVNGLLLEGYWPKAYDVPGRHGGVDEQDCDVALLLKAAGIIGRDSIKNQELRDRLADLDVEGGTS